MLYRIPGSIRIVTGGAIKDKEFGAVPLPAGVLCYVLLGERIVVGQQGEIIVHAGVSSSCMMCSQELPAALQWHS